MPPGQPLLRVSDLTLKFGGVTALADVDMSVESGTIHAIIGPNGAGKSSLLNCMSGLYRPTSGSVALRYVADDVGRGRRDQPAASPEADIDSLDIRERALTSLPPHRVARLGVARSFQNIELFDHLTVLENMMLGRHIHMKQNVLTSMLWFGPARRQEIAHREIVEEVVDLLKLQAYRQKPVGTLAYGIQKRVELGRALALQPSLLLLDEPMAGMNAEEKEDMARYILDVHELAGVSIVLIEHDMNVVMDISNRVTVLDFGKVIGDGTPQEVMDNPRVIEAYLGAGATS
ncbi:MAG: ABC transporter ATP-binding protein [Brevibacterium yomogidense]|uniref:ABC transporter ATP-binding protein n=1 Tax=Brevibacterium sp. Mu109 TaxID=1255669 RepID=UPI000C60449F|nr:ABC transporter ATP-binding protein [Brevibacterium sp. Mu109]SMX76488.1 branched-chain amino acid transport system ATP-binding protein [Brevibacterium sp. Mu109]